VAVSIIALHSSRLSYIVLFISTAIVAIEEQSLKAPFPIFITLSGIVREVKEEQPQKASSLMLVTLLGMIIEVKEEQL
jgi:hypothetical protein